MNESRARVMAEHLALQKGERCAGNRIRRRPRARCGVWSALKEAQPKSPAAGSSRSTPPQRTSSLRGRRSSARGLCPLRLPMAAPPRLLRSGRTRSPVNRGRSLPVRAQETIYSPMTTRAPFCCRGGGVKKLSPQKCPWGGNMSLTG